MVGIGVFDRDMVGIGVFDRDMVGTGVFERDSSRLDAAGGGPAIDARIEDIMGKLSRMPESSECVREWAPGRRPKVG